MYKMKNKMLRGTDINYRKDESRVLVCCVTKQECIAAHNSEAMCVDKYGNHRQSVGVSRSTQNLSRIIIY